METRIPARLSAAEGRRFAFTVGTAFLVLAGIAAWRHRSGTSTVLAVAGALLVSAGVVVPGRLGPLFRGWMGLAQLISKVTTPVFMAIVYYVVLTPAGLLKRGIFRSSLMPSRRAESVWVARPLEKRRSDLLRQF